MSSAPRAALSPENRSLLIVAIVLAIAFVASNVAANHQPEPHNLPVAIVGSPQVTDPVAGQLELSDLSKVISYSPARRPERRSLIGSTRFCSRPGPTLLVASAASLPADDVLRTPLRQ